MPKNLRVILKHSRGDGGFPGHYIKTCTRSLRPESEGMAAFLPPHDPECLAFKAFQTLNASRVAAGSWVRMWSAPFWAAKSSAANVAGPLCLASRPVIRRRKDLRDTDTRTGKPNARFSCGSSFSIVKEASGLEPRKNPIPGSRMRRERSMPAAVSAAMRRSKKAMQRGTISSGETSTRVALPCSCTECMTMSLASDAASAG